MNKGQKGRKELTDVFSLFIFFREDFSDDVSWDKRGSGTWRVQGGRLIGGGSDDNFMTSLIADPDFDTGGPLYVSVTTQWLYGGKDGRYGIYFYTDRGDGYGFFINANGSFVLNRWDDGGSPINLAGWTGN